MGSSKKATSLLPPELQERLTLLAKHRGTSLAEIVRQACEAEYGRYNALSTEARLEAVRRLASLSLPVGDPAEMERESVPSPDELLP
jgi:predicted DNA-binding protein